MRQTADSYGEYQQPVSKFIKAMVGDGRPLMTLVKETFRRIESTPLIADATGEDKVTVLRIAHQVCLNHLKITKAGGKPDDTRLDPGVRRPGQPPFREAVRSRFDRLPESYKSVLVFYDLLNLSHQEVAGILGIKPGTPGSGCTGPGPPS